MVLFIFSFSLSLLLITVELVSCVVMSYIHIQSPGTSKAKIGV